MRKTKPPVGWEHVKNCFPVPNILLDMDLPASAVAVYLYLLRSADRKTDQCHPSEATIAKRLHLSRNTVAKYVRLLEERGLIITEHTKIITKNGIKKNGNLLYTLVSMHEITQAYYDRQFEKQSSLLCSRKRRRKLRNWASSSSRRAMGKAHEYPVFAPVCRCVRPFGAGWSPNPNEGVGRFCPLLDEVARTKGKAG